MNIAQQNYDQQLKYVNEVFNQVVLLLYIHWKARKYIYSRVRKCLWGNRLGWKGHSYVGYLGRKVGWFGWSPP